METVGRQLRVLRAADYDARTYIKAPPEALAVQAGTAPPDTVTARFEVTFNNFTAEAQAAFQAAVDIWSTLLVSDVTIQVNANFTPLDPGVLGQAGPERIIRDFTNAPQANTWYAIALANKLAGSDLIPASVDISAEFSSAFPNWFFGTDGNTPVGQFDFVSVVLHELGHGLGFVGSADVDSGVGSWGIQDRPFIWDRFIVNNEGTSLIDTTAFPDPSPQLAALLQGGNLFFSGPAARAANGGQNVRVYAPNPFEGGSSFSHLDENTFPAGNANSLMTPQLGRAELIHNPGPVGLAIMADIGW